MQRRNKILSYFLLATYLLVVLHHSFVPSHDADLERTSNSVSHQHEDFDDVHHEHRFHVGVFHLLGHLLEKVNHSDDHSDEHLIVVQESSTKKVADHHQTAHLFARGNNTVAFSEDAESLPDPPLFHLFLSHRLLHPDTPLRAPPALV